MDWWRLWGIGATQSLSFMGMAFYVFISVFVFWCWDCPLYFAMDIYAEKNIDSMTIGLKLRSKALY
jgi:hypothetical protein